MGFPFSGADVVPCCVGSSCKDILLQWFAVCCPRCSEHQEELSTPAWPAAVQASSRRDG